VTSDEVDTATLARRLAVGLSETPNLWSLSSVVATIPLFLLIIVVFWFFMIRPQQKRQREAQQMRSALEPGTKVMLTSGILGTVSEITDDHIAVEIADGVALKVVRGAIGQVLPEEFGEPTADEDSENVNTTGDGVAVETIKPEEND
jgi:preprotein translocase subunit YajC